MIANLVEQHPGMATKAAFDAMGPIYQEAVAAYPELEGDPGLIRAIYDEVGGDQAFAGDLVAQEYEQVFPAESTAFRDETGKVVRTDPLTS